MFTWLYSCFDFISEKIKSVTLVDIQSATQNIFEFEDHARAKYGKRIFSLIFGRPFANSRQGDFFDADTES